MKKLHNVSINFNSKSELKEIEKTLNKLGCLSDLDWNNKYRNGNNITNVVIKHHKGLWFYEIHSHSGLFSDKKYNNLECFLYDYYGLKYKEFFIEYCEKFIDGTERICQVCELIDTHCEGAKCEVAYENYLPTLQRKEVMKDICSDFDFRNKYNSMSIRNKVGFKKYLK